MYLPISPVRYHDGPGIGPEHQERLSDRFYRTDTSRTRATGGSGLGLAITKHLVEAPARPVAVESTVGTGAAFTIRQPVQCAPRSRVINPPVRAPGRASLAVPSGDAVRAARR